jgi:ABC-type protease/lipase transport system fused ATPase/permease subunit
VANTLSRALLSPAFFLAVFLGVSFELHESVRGLTTIRGAIIIVNMITYSCAALSSKKGPHPGTRDRRAR